MERLLASISQSEPCRCKNTFSQRTPCSQARMSICIIPLHSLQLSIATLLGLAIFENAVNDSQGPVLPDVALLAQPTWATAILFCFVDVRPKWPSQRARDRSHLIEPSLPSISLSASPASLASTRLLRSWRCNSRALALPPSAVILSERFWRVSNDSSHTCSGDRK